jgi:hypothetical protein
MCMWCCTGDNDVCYDTHQTIMPSKRRWIDQIRCNPLACPLSTTSAAHVRRLHLLDVVWAGWSYEFVIVHEFVIVRTHAGIAIPQLRSAIQPTIITGIVDMENLVTVTRLRGCPLTISAQMFWRACVFIQGF